MNNNLLQQLLQQHYGTGVGLAVYFAPGRINLIGEHTDYNGGYVFPGAVRQGIMAALRPNGSRQVRAYAADLESECTFGIDDPDGPTNTHFRYLYGVVRELVLRGVAVQGFDTVYAGDVPLGAGMSSSAALESCFSYGLNDLFGGHLERMELARVGQATEHKYVGVKCGIMDQFISLHGHEESLVRLDCRSGEYRYYPWHPQDYRLLLVNSRVKHELVGSPYNDRRESCERVARVAGVETLRDCTLEQLESLRPHLTAEDYSRARFVLGEEQRVLTVCDALERDDYETVGQQMYLTHQGLSLDYHVSCDELDYLVDEAKRCGVTGARIMGGGFGGCTINLVRNDRYDAFADQVQQRYRTRFGIDCELIPVVIGGGARKVEL